MIASLRSHCSLALRPFLRQRGLTLTALFSLTLGIGVTTGTFTLLNAMALRPLPGISAQDRLLTLWLSVRGADGPSQPWWLSYPDFQAVQRAAGSFSGMAAAGYASVSLDADGSPHRVAAELVTPEYFAVLGTRPAQGRLPTSAEEDAAVISYAYWQAHFGGGDVVGRGISVNGHAFTVVGVAPEGFHGMTPVDATASADSRLALWLPIRAAARVRPLAAGGDALRALDQRWLRVVARTRDGVTPAAARASVAALGGALAAEFPRERTGAALVPGDLAFGPDASRARLVLLFAGFLVVPLLVLLIACVNVAGLLLASGTSRQRELAVRLSLGASRGRIIALLMRENVLLALAAGVLSLIVAAWTQRIAVLFSIRPGVAVPIDWRVLVFAFGTALLTALLFGLLPALRATRLQPTTLLAGGASSESGRTGRLRAVLVTAQLALCFVLLVVCALFVRSTARGMEVATGYAEDELLLVDASLDVLGASPAEADVLFAHLAEQLAAVPGVSAVGSAGGMPLLGARGVRVSAGSDVAYGERAGAEEVGSGYFEAAGLALVAGSGFDARDRGVPPARAVVNRTLAERLWPERSPLGRTLRLQDANATQELTVIGVAGDARGALRQAPEPMVYLPLETGDSQHRVFLIRTRDDFERVIPAVRAAFRATDPRLPVPGVSTLRDLRQQALLPYRLTSAGLGTLGLLALLLAAVGLYGLVSYNVARRTREIGVRVALGATRAEVARWVVRGSLGTLAAGLATGLPVAAALAFALRGGLFGVSPLDPLSFGAIALVLVLVTLLGTLLPARRAAAVPPAIAIRSD